jgi:hypothetical protein
MEVDLASRQRRASMLSLFRLDAVPVLPSKFLIVAALLISSFCSTPGFCYEAGEANLQKLFHLVGIPGLRRDERVNLTPTSDGLLFETKKIQYRVPYSAIHQVLLLSADRRYEGRTYAAALATYGIGSLFILKKHHVDTVVLDYVNERGGKMGIVVQMETSQGEYFKNVLKDRGISITEPEPASESASKEQPATDRKARSNP